VYQWRLTKPSHLDSPVKQRINGVDGGGLCQINLRNVIRQKYVHLSSDGSSSIMIWTYMSL